MLQVNLLPWRKVHRQQRVRFWLTVSVCFPALLLVSLLGSAVFLAQQRTLLQQHLAALKHASQALSLQQRSVETASAQVKILLAQRLVSQQRAQRSRDSLQMLILLAEKIPEEVRLNDLVELQNQLTLTGEGRFYHDILAFRDTLATSDLLREVTLSDIRQQSGVMLGFVLKMQLRQPPEQGALP